VFVSFTKVPLSVDSQRRERAAASCSPISFRFPNELGVYRPLQFSTHTPPFLSQLSQRAWLSLRKQSSNRFPQSGRVPVLNQDVCPKSFCGELANCLSATPYFYLPHFVPTWFVSPFWDPLPPFKISVSSTSLCCCTRDLDCSCPSVLLFGH